LKNVSEMYKSGGNERPAVAERRSESKGRHGRLSVRITTRGPALTPATRPTLLENESAMMSLFFALSLRQGKKSSPPAM
jgi:hypothetical protein